MLKSIKSERSEKRRKQRHSSNQSDLKNNWFLLRNEEYSNFKKEPNPNIRDQLDLEDKPEETTQNGAQTYDEIKI